MTPRCNDCELHDGTCPYDGSPCDPRRDSIDAWATRTLRRQAATDRQGLSEWTPVVVDGQVVGETYLRLWMRERMVLSSLDPEPKDNNLVLSNVRINSPLRGQGHFVRLLSACDEVAERHGWGFYVENVVSPIVRAALERRPAYAPCARADCWRRVRW